MLFLANVERSEFGRDSEEKGNFRLEGNKLRQVLRRARKEPNASYIIQRKETLIRDLENISNTGKSVSLFLTGYVHKGNTVRCYFANSKFRSLNSTIELSDLCKILHESGSHASYVFLSVDGDWNQDTKYNADTDGYEICLCLVAKQHEKFCALLAAEITSWDGVRSLQESNITHKYVGRQIETLVRRLTEHYGNMTEYKDWEIINRISSDETAWTPRRSIAIGVNEHKLLYGRSEQVLDELNRLAQAAADREYSPQASFWFSELNEDITSLYKLLPNRLLIYADSLGEKSEIFSYAEKITSKVDPGKDILHALLQKFLRIPSGSFYIGKDSHQHESEPPAIPRHVVKLDDYMIMQSPITRKEWQYFAPNHNNYNPMEDAHPAVNISFLESMEMASHITGLLHKHNLIDEDKVVAVPSEAQWEKAARGTDGREYPWGDIFNKGYCNVASTGLGRTSAVGDFSPVGNSPYGCQDMAGNIREWTTSYGGTSIRSHNLYPYDESKNLKLNTMRPEIQMIVRGGSFSYDDDCVKTWVRNKEVAFQKRADTGVRFIIEKKSVTM